ncbi:uncharacterized protein LOC133338128 [Musca vetustissima]|uniref:uncharacterized protein LOC133338128 n=1 Tax=Musca vetustissima TaxID=27455 RepID=UPI002AB6DFE1|nr:uncharacterized protein LOC133338128 [Musca vetustissima]
MNYFFMISYLLILFLGLGTKTACNANDSPGFFVKIAKNVPRLGRRSDKLFTFLKNYKAIPRIGRSSEGETTTTSFTNWLDTQFHMKMEKRIPHNSIDKDLTLVQPVNTVTLKELIDTHAIVGENVRFIHWKDFDRALQSDSELFGKISSIGRKPDQHLKEDLTKEQFTPIVKNLMDTDGTDFLLYTQGEQHGPGHYAPEFLRYNMM